MSTEILTVDEISQSDADKFITHNTANRQIEGQRTRVISRSNGGPPGSPSNGDVYIVDVASGTWSSATVKDVAHYFGGQWVFYTPVEGVQRFWVNDEDVAITYNGSAWINEAIYSMGGPFTTGAITFGDAGGSGITFDASNLFWDDSNNRLGIGNATPAKPLDVTGDIVTDSDVGCATMTATGLVSGGTVTSTGDLRVGSTGNIATGGEISPDVDDGGICILHGTGGGNALTLKQSNVSHPFTTQSETDTYAELKQVAAGQGGFLMKCYAETGLSRAIQIDSNLADEITSDTGFGPFLINSTKSNGVTSVSTISSAGNLFSTANNGSTKVVIKGNGDIVTQGGIRLSGGSDLFDAYEEGTWTPALADDTLSAGEGQTHSLQDGTYVRSGNLVHIACRMTVSSLGSLTATQGAKIINLPFTSSSGASRNSVHFGFGGSLSIVASVVLAGYIQPNTSYIVVQQWNATTGTSAALVSNITASGSIMLTATYEV